jgi:hypothetical protein
MPDPHVTRLPHRSSHFLPSFPRTHATPAQAYPATGVDPHPDLFGACLRARHLLYIHKEDAATIPGFSELYDDLTVALDRAIGE